MNMTSNKIHPTYNNFDTKNIIHVVQPNIIHNPPFEDDRTQVKQYLSSNENKLIFFKFYADWCGPCKECMPSVINEFNNINTSSKKELIEINVDEYQSITSLYKISSIPTIISFKEGMKHNVVISSNQNEIENFFRNH